MDSVRLFLMTNLKKKIISVNRTNLSNRHNKRKISFIVLHTVAGYGSPYEWFKQSVAKASSHFFVGFNGSIEQFVPLYQASWHAGTRSFDGNRESIGIEFEDGGHPEDVARTDLLYEAGSNLLAYLSYRFDVPLHLGEPATRNGLVIGVPPACYRHRDIRPGKTCPGGLDVNRLLSLAKQRKSHNINDSDLFTLEQEFVML